MSTDDPSNWRSVVDVKSGRTYWYHRLTRETTWNKPSCLDVYKPPPIETPIIARDDSKKALQANGLKYKERNNFEQETTSITHETSSAHVSSSQSDINLKTCVRMIFDKAENARIKAITTILSQYLKVEMLESILEIHGAVISSLVDCVISFRLPEHKAIAARLLWLLSLSPGSNAYFAKDGSWISLVTFLIEKSGLDETLLYYAAICSNMFMTKRTMDLVPEYTQEVLINWLKKDIKSDAKAALLESLLKQSKECGDKSLSLFGGSMLLCYAELTARGFMIPGMLFNILFSWLIRTTDREYADELLTKYGISSIQKIICSFSTPKSVRHESREVLNDAMSVSAIIRSRILDNLIDLSSNIDAMGHVAKSIDPRIMHVEYHNIDNSNYDEDDIEDDDDSDLPILRDIEWKSQNRKSWRLCSSLMWLRCPGLRSIIDEFWDAGGGGLELNIDASWDTLNSVCRYIHTGALVVPVRFLHKLELIKVSIELEMNTLTNLAVENVIYHITETNLNISLEFAKAMNLNDMVEFCKQFKTTSKHVINPIRDVQKSNHVLSGRRVSSVSDDNDSLHKAIKESIQAVSDINREYHRINPMQPSNRLNENQSELTIDAKSVGQHQKRQDGKVRSGGIYGLLLDNMDEPSNVNPRDTNHSTKPVNEASKSLKAASTPKALNQPSKKPTDPKKPLPSTSKASHSVIKGNIALAEYQPSMSLENIYIPDEKRYMFASDVDTRSYEDEDSSRNSSIHASSPIIVETTSSKVIPASVRSSLQLLKTKTKRMTEERTSNPSSYEGTLRSDTTVSEKGSTNGSNRSMQQSRGGVHEGGNLKESVSITSLNVPENKSNKFLLRSEATSYDDNDENLDDSAEFVLSNPSNRSNPSNLSNCPECGRSFNPESLQRHIKICAKVFSSSRKKFDSTKQRLNPEVIQIIKTNEKMKSNSSHSSKNQQTNVENAVIPKWKADSEAFRQSMKAARSGNTGSYQPSVPDPSLIECPHCNRRFNANAADRHIPLCKNIRAKPTSLKKGSGGSAKGAVPNTPTKYQRR